MKRILLAALAAGASWVVWTKVQQEREERAIWAEVTDSFGQDPAEELPYTPSAG
ncbi:MAG: DLW-39 family protein [bacterium]|nr:DLW-39 family protein [bacterium]